MNREDGLVLSLLGSGGGVAKAVLTILNEAAGDPGDPLYRHIRGCRLHLVDVRKKNIGWYQSRFPRLQNQLVFHPFDLDDLDRFRTHLRETGTQVVIDVSWGDTVAMIQCCHEQGVRYVNTALESKRVDEMESLAGVALLERYEIFENNRKRFDGMTGIVCSGMNPGVVQWMALELIRRRPEKKPLACYIVEHDDSFFADPALADGRTLYTTWSPECFLDEALDAYPMFCTNRMPVFLYREVYEQEFGVTLGDRRFHGCLMPHEETVSLGTLLDVETAFLYRVNEHTTRLLRDHLDKPDDVWDLPMQVLDPAQAELTGEDLIGVLLVYDDGERYVYNVMNNKETAARYGTNATYFQVACGVYGGLASLVLDDLPAGLFFVDELLQQTGSRYGEYVRRYMKVFVTGISSGSDGLLFDRMKPIR